MNIRSYFNYDPATGEFSGFKRGTVTLCGGLTIDGTRYALHRLAWWWAYGALPRYQIKHVNGNKRDNRLCNLTVYSKRYQFVESFL